METKQVICTSCGRTLEVPTELDVFSCVYCGARNGQTASPEETLPIPEAALATLDPLYAPCFQDRDSYLRNFTRGAYVDAFFAHEAKIRPLFTAMDELLCQDPSRARLLADRFLDARLRALEEEKGWKFQPNRKKLLFDAKLLLAWYTLPAIRDLNLPTGDLQADTLAAAFRDRYPKDPIEAGTLEEISSGFKRKGLCFITTAICEFEGKPDDCAELTAFRSFRDGWLAATPQGPAQIEEYYRVAPAVVMAIDLSPDRALRYAQLRRDWLRPCYEDLQAGRPAACRDRYTAMVRTLTKEYCPFLQ